MDAGGDLALLARATGGMIVVLALAVVLGRLARRGRRRRDGAGPAVLDRVGLSRDAQAVVLEVEGRRLLLGVGPQAVTLLTTLHDPTPDHPTPDPPTPPAPSGNRAPSGNQAPAQDPAAPRTDPIHRPADVALPAGLDLAAYPDLASALRAAGRTVPGPRPPLTGAKIVDGRVVLTGPPATDRPRRSRGTGAALDPRTWLQGLDALRDLTTRR